MGAPGAYTAQLAGQISAPAGVAISNLQQMGGVANAANEAEKGATQTYLGEAQAALPLIAGEQNHQYDLQAGTENLNQQARMAALARAAASSRALSDSELRNRLLGYAVQQRQALIDAANQGVTQARPLVAQARNVAVSGAPTQPNTSDFGRRLGPIDATSPGAIVPRVAPHWNPVNDPAYAAVQTRQQALEQELAQMRAQQYGPGITQVAQQAGIAAGLDPARVTGILTPQVDAAYVAANQKLGLYQDPTKQQYTGSVLDPAQAGKTLGFDDRKVQQVLGTSYVNFGSPRVDAAFAAWANASDPNGTKYGKGVITNPNSGNTQIQFTDQGLAQARRDFQTSTTGQRLASNLLADTVKAGVDAAKSGIDITTWANMMTPEEQAYYQANPDVLKFAAAQLQPVFAYYQALRTRQATVPDATSAGALDQSTADALGLPAG